MGGRSGKHAETALLILIFQLEIIQNMLIGCKNDLKQSPG